MPIELSVAFGQILRAYRKRKGWSQMKLAMEAGMHLNALGNLERGLYSPSLQTVFMLCQALGVSVAEFMAALEIDLAGQPVPTAASESTEHKKGRSKKK